MNASDGKIAKMKWRPEIKEETEKNKPNTKKRKANLYSLEKVQCKKSKKQRREKKLHSELNVMW